MDKQEYLNQISASARPVSSPRSKLFSSKLFWFGIISFALLIFIIIVGSIIGSTSTSTKDSLTSLALHINNTSEVIQEYQPNIKSSKLRSDGSSLQTILASNGQYLTDYLASAYSFKTKDAPKSIQEEELSAKDALSSELFAAKINGFLDSTYAQKMAYEISLIMSNEAKIINSTSNTDLRDKLTGFYNSLNTLYPNFSEFSES